MTRTWIPGTVDEDLSALAATPRLVVALDFDGTASPLVVEPMAARALPEVAAQVARLAACPDTLVAYVSGRSMRDLREIAEHDDDSLIALAGSHGVEYWYPGVGEVDDVGADAADVADDDGEREALWAAAGPIIDRHPGIVLEPKAFGMGVHARRADPETEERAFAEIDALVSERHPQWRRRLGHRILEFSSRAEGKDAAIGALRSRFGATGILFAGDDVTDEDAIRALGPDDLGVRVGPGETVATLRVAGPQEIARLLEALADERTARRE